MTIKLKNWLKPLETAGFKCNIYVCYKVGNDFEEELIYVGSMRDIPYWLTYYQIGFCDNDPDAAGLEPIAWCHGLHKTIDEEEKTDINYEGFCIYLKEENE